MSKEYTKYELRSAKNNLEFHLTANFSGRETLKESMELSVALIKQALTPPTEEEVRKALSEYYKTEMYYENTKYKDGFHNGNVFAIMYENNEVKFTTKYFDAKLPAHIIELIGSFYKEE